jgi:hypothetical protein
MPDIGCGPPPVHPERLEIALTIMASIRKQTTFAGRQARSFLRSLWMRFIPLYQLP